MISSILQTIILQTVLYLENYHLANCIVSCKLSSCKLFLFLSCSVGPWTMVSLPMEWRWILGASLQFKLISTVFLPRMWVEKSSSFYCFCLFYKVFLLTMYASIAYLESLDRHSFCCGSEPRGGRHHLFWGYPTLGRILVWEFSTWLRGFLASWWVKTRHKIQWILPYSCLPTLRDECWVPIVEEWHTLHQAAFGRPWLW